MCSRPYAPDLINMFDPKFFANAVIDETCRVLSAPRSQVFDGRLPFEAHKPYLKAAYYLIWKHTGWSGARVARFFGKHPQTVLGHINAVRDAIEAGDMDVINTVDRIETALRRRGAEDPVLRPRSTTR